MDAKRVTGVTTGTGAQISISCGGIPKGVKLFNTTSGDQLEWNESMAAGAGFKRIAAGTGSYVTTGGITVGTVNTIRGFYIGTDSDINASAEPIVYEAWW